MKNNLFLLIIIGILFWTCSDDSPISINQFSIEDEELSSSIDHDNYGINISGETSYTSAYKNGYIRSDRIKLELDAEEENFLNFEIYRKNEAVTETGHDWGYYGLTHNPDDDDYIEHFYDEVSESDFTYWDETLSQDSYFTYQIVTRYTNGTYNIDEIIIKTPEWEAPSNLTFTPLSPNKAQINWEDNCDSEDNFKLKIGSESYELNKNTISYTTDNLTANETFQITVKAINSYEEPTAKAILNNNQIIFNTPTNFNVNSSEEKAYLSWSDDSNVTSGYYIQRKTDNSGWTRIATISSSLNEYTDEDNLLAGTTYYYKIKGFNDYDNIETTTYTSQQSTEIVIGYFFDFENENIPDDWVATDVSLITNDNNGVFDSSWGIQFSGGVHGGAITIPTLTIPQNTDITISFYFKNSSSGSEGRLIINNTWPFHEFGNVNEPEYVEYSYTENMGANESLDIIIQWDGAGRTLDMDHIRISW